MNISVDGGALCSKKENRFGTYIYIKHLLRAIDLYDKENKYIVYTFCNKKVNCKNSNISFVRCIPHTGYMPWQIGVREILNPADVFIGASQIFPVFIRAKKIAVCHGLAFFFYPRFYQDSYKFLLNQLNLMIKYSDFILVSSEKVKEELCSIFSLNEKVKVLPFGSPNIGEIANLNINDSFKSPYILNVGMDNPIKNQDELVNSFLKAKKKSEKLFIIGTKKKYKSVDVLTFSYLPYREIFHYYKNAVAYVTTSLYESFNFPVLEALFSDCPVIAYRSAVIPELRPFVTIVNNKDELIESISDIFKNSNHYRRKVENFKRIKKIFSWESYIKNLNSLYKL